MKFKLFLLLAFAFGPVLSVADEESYLALPWSLSKGMAESFSKDSDPGKKAWGSKLVSLIDFGKKGEKSIYFNVWYADSETHEGSATSYCDPEKFYDKGVIFMNGQAINVLRWCNKMPGANINYLTVAPQTAAGKAYIINALSRASGTVDLTLDNIDFKISGVGFTTAWNKTSDKAL